MTFPLNRPTGLIQSLSLYVRMLYVCAIAKTRFQVYWRFLLQDRIANINIPLDFLKFWFF